MSNVLTGLRDELKATLVDAGFVAHTFKPAKAVPPFALIAPADPYITSDGATFGGEIVRYQVVLVAASGVNEKQAVSLDELLLGALDALYDHPDLVVGPVDRPGQIDIGGQTYLAVPIDVQKEIHR